MSDETQQLCVYCLARPGTTHDHVPPKALFSKPRPSDLITVPACDECNSEFEKDEEYIRGLFRFSQAGLAPSMQKLWPKIDRMLSRSSGLRNVIATGIKKINIMTAEGLWAGKRLAMETDWQRIAHIVGKLVKGLYFAEFGEALPSSVYLDFPECHAENVDLSEPHSITRRGKRSWPGTFEYKCERVADSPTESAWLFRFFGHHVFVAFTSKYENPEDAEHEDGSD